MLTEEQSRNRVEGNKAAWISIQTRTSKPFVEEEPRRIQSLANPVRLFEQAQQAPLLLPERFPRLTFFAIAVAVLVSAVMTEIDYLRGAGYHW
jgi:hypothetical protein